MFNYSDFRKDFIKGEVNPYAILSKSAQRNYRQRNYSNMFMDVLSSMFEYEKSEIYKQIDDRTIEQTLILNGINGFCEDGNGQIVCGFAYDGGLLDQNGIGDTISINLLNGLGFHKNKDTSKVVVGLNNSTRSADFDVFMYADWLSEVSLSEENNVRFTRINPVYIAKNRKIWSMIREAMNKLKSGEPIVISDNSMTLNEKTNIIQTTSITDTASVDKLQYLTTYHNAVLRRFYNKYGFPISEGMKQAQQSTTEVANNSSSASIVPYDRLKQRQIMCKALEDTFGGSIKVKFSKAWHDNFTNNNERMVKDSAENIEVFNTSDNT